MQSDRERPTFTAEELREIEPDDAALAAELDADQEDAEIVAGMRRAGLSDDEIQRVRGVAPEPPPPSLREVEQEIDELMDLRRSDRRKYWSDAVQARHLALIELQQKLKAQGETEDTDPSEGERLGDDLPEALREAWESDPIGVVGNIEAIRSRTVLALGELPEEEHDSLLDSFDAELDDAERTTIAEQLAMDHGNSWRPASDAEVGAFAETEWGAATLERWGRQGPKLLGIAKKEADGILGRLTATSRLKVERWAMSKSVSQRRALVEMLAARAMRRL